MNTTVAVAQEIALRFAQDLAQRNYALAYTFTSQEYQQHMSLNAVRETFECIIPEDWGAVTSIQVVGDVLQDWPDKQPTDIGWVYVSLEGEVYPYSEGLFILIAQEGELLKIRDIEFGRP